jgi:hypothetical protein
VAVLQATNAFVDGVPEVQHGDEEPSDSPEPSDGPESSDAPESSDSAKGSDSLGGSDSPGAPASPRKSAPPRASRKASSPYDYVSEVLSRMQSSTRRPGWTAPGPPEPD